MKIIMKVNICKNNTINNKIINLVSKKKKIQIK